MYKTIWMIERDNGIKTKLIFYHFGKEPKIPTWYFKKDTIYTIEMLWNLKLINTISMFYKCLFHKYIVK